MHADTADLELISFNLCPYVQRAIIVLGEKSIPHRRTYISLADKPDWFKEISPLGKVPLLHVGDRTLFESTVICEYLNEITPGDLHPSDPLEKAEHRSWIEFGSSILDSIGAFYGATTEEAFEEKRQALSRKFDWLEANLSDGPLFSGEEFHLVDAVYPTIFRYFDVLDRIDDFGVLSSRPNVSRYRRAVMARPSVATAVLPTYDDELMQFFLNKGSMLSARAKIAA